VDPAVNQVSDQDQVFAASWAPDSSRFVISREHNDFVANTNDTIDVVVNATATSPQAVIVYHWLAGSSYTDNAAGTPWGPATWSQDISQITRPLYHPFKTYPAGITNLYTLSANPASVPPPTYPLNVQDPLQVTSITNPCNLFGAEVAPQFFAYNHLVLSDDVSGSAQVVQIDLTNGATLTNPTQLTTVGLSQYCTASP
jgi:hypothetical protein